MAISKERQDFLAKHLNDSSINNCTITHEELDWMVATRAIDRSKNKVQAMESNTSDGSTADYYKLPQDCKQLQNLISFRDMNAQLGEIFRAVYRYGIVAHSDKARDIKKIIFYAQAELSRLENYSTAVNINERRLPNEE